MRNLARAALAAIFGGIFGVLEGLTLYGPAQAGAFAAIANGVVGGIACGTLVFTSGADRGSVKLQVIGAVAGTAVGTVTLTAITVGIALAFPPTLGDVARIFVGPILNGSACVVGTALGGIIDFSVLGRNIGTVKGHRTKD